MNPPSRRTGSNHTKGLDASPPRAAEVAAVKRLAAGIIRTQGNRFIKELLRTNGVRIGTNKDAFEHNLSEAADRGDLRLEHLDEWLRQVEGWGNQHVYLYRLSPALREALSEADVRRRVRAAGLDEVWDAPTMLAFPEEPTLTSISYADSMLRVVWQETSPGWNRELDMDFQTLDGIDTIEYRAWRMVEHRAITRFVANLPLELAALFVPDPVAGEEHRQAVTEARRVLGMLLDLTQLDATQVDISLVSRNLDQRNVPDNRRPNPDVKTQKSRLSSGAAYVEFAANSADHAYWEENAIRDVRRSVRDQQLPAFQGTGGTFVFQPGAAGGRLSRQLRVQLYGDNDRIRLWAQMQEEEVWTVLTELSTYQ